MGGAVGPDLNKQFGVTETLMKGILPDAVNSIRALVDKELRQKVVAANRASDDLRSVHIQGIGHEL